MASPQNRLGRMESSLRVIFRAEREDASLVCCRVGELTEVFLFSITGFVIIIEFSVFIVGFEMDIGAEFLFAFWFGGVFDDSEEVLLSILGSVVFGESSESAT